MSLIIAENITKAFGTLEVMKNISFRLGETERVGLVGPNGEGKTTMLRIIAGLAEPTAGQLHRARDMKLDAGIGYLPQDPPRMGDATLYDSMLAVFADLIQMERDVHDLADRLAAAGDDPALLEKYGQLQHRFEDLGGYDYTNRIEQTLTGLNFPRSMWTQPVSQFSGGQCTRAYLAKLILMQPTVLMLDEPTNHLDLDSVEWLEQTLATFRGALVVVSHDRYFLDNVTTATWEIAAGSLETYRGSYSTYLTKREERLADKMRVWESQQEYISTTRDFIAKHIAGQRTKEAQGRRTKLERFIRDEAIEKPLQNREIHLPLKPARRAGDIVIRARDLQAGYQQGKPLVSVESLELLRGQRVAIVGANGIGKTTLLRTLLGQLEPLAGEVTLGSNVSVGYLSQTHAELEPNSTVLDAVMKDNPTCTTGQARDVLGSLLFIGDDVFKKISEISGGQRSRVVLARLVVQNANLLMLDEPTNHLDIPSTEILQEALAVFEGAVMFVSHDRYLIQSVATHIWAIDETGLREILGGWDAFVQWRESRKNKPPAKGSAAPATSACQCETVAEDIEKSKTQRKEDYKNARKQSNLTQRLKRRHEELESLIEKTEQSLADLHDEISQAGMDGDMARIEKLGLEFPKKEDELKKLWQEWEQVGEELG